MGVGGEGEGGGGEGGGGRGRTRRKSVRAGKTKATSANFRGMYKQHFLVPCLHLAIGPIGPVGPIGSIDLVRRASGNLEQNHMLKVVQTISHKKEVATGGRCMEVQGIKPVKSKVAFSRKSLPVSFVWPFIWQASRNCAWQVASQQCIKASPSSIERDNLASMWTYQWVQRLGFGFGNHKARSGLWTQDGKTPTLNSESQQPLASPVAAAWH